MLTRILVHLILSFTLFGCDVAHDRTEPQPEDTTPEPKDATSIPVWSVLLGSDQDDIGFAMARTSDDHFIIAGGSFGDYQGESNLDDPDDGFQSTDIILSKLNLEGDHQWSRVIGTVASMQGNTPALFAPERHAGAAWDAPTRTFSMTRLLRRSRWRMTNG